MPRAKKPSAPPTADKPTIDQLLNLSADDLIKERIRLRDWMEAEEKRFSEYLKPHRDRQQAIDDRLMGMLNDQKMEKFSTESGTAYKSVKMNLQVTEDGTGRFGEAVGREALLDFAVENWEKIGNELLIIRPQVDAVKRWMDEHDGQPPPGVKIFYFTTLNVRRS